MSNNDKDLIILRDSWEGSELSLVESIDTPRGECSNSVVLATLRGPALDYIRDTRNNRRYEEDLWDSVAKSDYVKELLETKNFLGEPDHPMQWENRADIHYPYVSHAVRELIKRPELGYYEVVIDILDTPNGRILKTLIDYGVKLGVSSRGSGSTIRKNNRNIVDKRTYKFITIDVVPMPGNRSARMEQSHTTNESVKVEELLSALTEQIEFLYESNNTDSLRYTKMLLDRLEYPECNSLLEKVNSYLDESNTNTDSSKDLVEAYALVSELKSQIAAKDLIIQDLAEKVNNSSDKQNTLSGLEESYSKAKDLVRSSLMNESTLRKENHQLKATIDNLNSRVEEMNESISKLNENNNSLEAKVKNLKLEAYKNQSLSFEDAKSYQDSIDQKNNDIESLTEQLQYLTNNTRDIYESYFRLRCGQLGLNSDIVRRGLGDISSYSVDQLNSHLNESFKLLSKQSDRVVLPKGTYDFRESPSSTRVMNESSDNSKRLSDLERISRNTRAVSSI